MNDHLMGADVLGYPDIRISAFEIFGFFRIFCYCGRHFRPRKLKLGVNAHLIGVDVLGSPDIRISASRFFRIFGPYKAILKARMVKLVVDDPLKGADVLGYPDYRISASGFFGYLSLTVILEARVISIFVEGSSAEKLRFLFTSNATAENFWAVNKI